MTITNPYYEFDPAFIPGTKVRSDDVNLQYQAIQNAFDSLPGDSGAITTGTSTFAPESGTGNAYVVTMPDTRLSEQDGDEVVFFATHTNTLAATLNVDSLGAHAIVRADGVALTAGDIVSGLLYVVRYDASNTRYQLVGPTVSYLTDATTQAAASAASAVASDASATASAASAVEAMQWAVNPEDDDVDSDPGQFSAFHWAQKALGAATLQSIVADITTATPPTTEAVTAKLIYQDADSTDLLAEVGFDASNAFVISNKMHDGNILFIAEDATGTPQTILALDPAGAITAKSDTGIYMVQTNPPGSFGIYTESTVANSASYFGAVNNETGQYIEIAAFGSTYSGGGKPHHLFFSSTDAPLVIQGDLGNFIKFEDVVAERKASVDASMFLLERAAAIADVATYGQFWVRNDAPNLPMFTDDDGTDFILNSSFTDGTVTGATINWDGADWAENTSVITSAGSVFLTERATAAGSTPALGQIWVRSLSPNQLKFTDDIGTDYTVALPNNKAVNTPWLYTYNVSATIPALYVRQGNTSGPYAAFFQNGSVTATGGTHQVDIGPTGNIKQTGALFQKEASAAQTDVTAFGQFWVKDDVPNVPMFTNDAGDDFILNANSGSNILSANYLWGGAGLPLTNEVRSSTATLNALATLYFDDDTLDGVDDFAAIAAQLQIGQLIEIANADDLSEYNTFRIDGAIVDSTTRWDVPVKYIGGTQSASGNFTAASQVRVSINAVEILSMDNIGVLHLDTAGRVTTHTDLVFDVSSGLRVNSGVVITAYSNDNADYLRTRMDSSVNSGFVEHVGAGNYDLKFEDWDGLLLIDGATTKWRQDIGGSMFLAEQTAAIADVATLGQIWVKDDVPNTLWFTDDAGNDSQLSSIGSQVITWGTGAGGTYQSGSFGTYQSGATTSYESGSILEIQEAATMANPAAGYGRIWVRSDAPNSLMFTDDAGDDFPIGYNIVPKEITLATGNLTLSQAQVGYQIFYDIATARSILMNNDSTIDVGAMWSYIVGPTGGTLTGDGGTGVTISWWNGSGWTTTAAAANMTIGEGSGTIWKDTDTHYFINGPNLS